MSTKKTSRLKAEAQKRWLMDRRRLLNSLGKAGAMAFFGPKLLSPGRALADAASASDKFIIYIHAGSWDGLATGLLQPQTPGVWQKGIFDPNSTGGSVNPNLNVHHKVGNLVLNNYTAPLAAISDHVCVATGDPRNASHFEARNLQITGSLIKGANSSWIAGVAQALHAGQTSPSIISVSGDPIEQIVGINGTDVSVIEGSTLPSYRSNFQDSQLIPAGPHASRLWNVLYDIHQQHLSLSTLQNNQSAFAVNYLQNLVTPNPTLQDGSAIVTQVQTAFTRAKVNATIDQYITDANDGAAVKSSFAVTPSSSAPAGTEDKLFNFLQLAGIQALSGLSKGASIVLDDNDLHAGGSSVSTARAGAQVISQLVTFWQNVIKPNNLQDKVMIILSHEFSRTPYNAASVSTALPTSIYDPANPHPQTDSTNLQLFSGGTLINQITSPGTDHEFAMGMIFINGKVPAAGRIGGLADHYTPLGSTDFQGMVAAGTPGYNSTQLIGSMLMRCFDDVFTDALTVRQYWADFVAPIPFVVA